MQRESQRNEVPFLGLLGSLTSEVLELGRELGFPSLGLVLVVWPLTTLHLCPALGHSSLSRGLCAGGGGVARDPTHHRQVTRICGAD